MEPWLYLEVDEHVRTQSLSKDRPNISKNGFLKVKNSPGRRQLPSWMSHHEHKIPTMHGLEILSSKKPKFPANRRVVSPRPKQLRTTLNALKERPTISHKRKEKQNYSLPVSNRLKMGPTLRKRKSLSVRNDILSDSDDNSYEDKNRNEISSKDISERSLIKNKDIRRENSDTSPSSNSVFTDTTADNHNVRFPSTEETKVADWLELHED
jgi:hypothetical protein